MSIKFFGDFGRDSAAVAVQDAAMAAMCRRPERGVLCIRCGGGDVVRLGRRDVTVMDVPSAGRPVRLTVKKQRWRCKGCNRIFFDDRSGCFRGRRMTVRLVEYIVQEVRHRRIGDVAKEIGVTVRTIYNVVRGGEE